MADTGAPYFIPYVEPTDLVRDYPAADEASADAIAAALDAIPVLAGIGSNVVTSVFDTAFSASVAGGEFTNPSGFEVTITPTSATSKVLLLVHVSGIAKPFGTVNAFNVRLKRGTTVIAVPPTAGSRTLSTTAFYLQASASSEEIVTTGFHHLDSPATASATTYTVEVGSLVSTTLVTVNRSKTDVDNGLNSRTISTITAIEVAA